MLLIYAVILLAVAGILAICRYTTWRSPLPLRWLRAQLWFIHVGSWNYWLVMARWSKHRAGLFRNRGILRPPTFGRRWGGYVLGLEIGNRGGTRRNVRHSMRLDGCPYAADGIGCGDCGARPKPRVVELQAPVRVARGTGPHATVSLRDLHARATATGELPEKDTRVTSVQAHRDGQLVGEGRGWHVPDYEGGEMKAAAELAADTKPICKMRIAGGNGNPASAHRECGCTHPSSCRLGGGGVAPAGPEQDAPTQKLKLPRP